MRMQPGPLRVEPGEISESPAFDEAAFQRWYAGWAKTANINPNPDDPRHFYNYRATFQAGATPSIDPEDGRYHWPSLYKRKGHPNLIINGINTRTGLPASPPKPTQKPQIQNTDPSLPLDAWPY